MLGFLRLADGSVVLTTLETPNSKPSNADTVAAPAPPPHHRASYPQVSIFSYNQTGSLLGCWPLYQRSHSVLTALENLNPKP